MPDVNNIDWYASTPFDVPAGQISKSNFDWVTQLAAPFEIPFVQADEPNLFEFITTFPNVPQVLPSISSVQSEGDELVWSRGEEENLGMPGQAPRYVDPVPVQPVSRAALLMLDEQQPVEEATSYASPGGGGSSGAVVMPVTYAAVLSSGKLLVTFDRNVLDTIQLRDPSMWTIGLPGGAGPVYITHVETVPSLGTTATCYLTLNGELLNGGAYTVTLAAGVARAAVPTDLGENGAVPAPWTGVGVGPTVTGVFAVSSVKVRVQFSKAVRQVNPANTDDALHTANYAIVDQFSNPLAVTSVLGIQSNLVELTTATQSPTGAYSMTISNIKDLAGNVVT